MGSLQDKVVIVTGGSRGIGRAIALELGRQGCRVAVNYHSNADAADAVVREIVDAGGEAQAIQGDVSVAEDAQALVEQALERFGALDILVNNAGITRDTLLMRMSEEDWDVVLDTNLKGAFHCVKAAQRTFLRKRAGCIINIGSVAGLMGNAGQANYSAAKAGLIGFTKALARELGSRNIRANLVAPGFIETEMTAKLPEAMLAQVSERIPLQRLGQPEDVAAVVTFLASDAAAYMTGQVVCIDGGLAM